MSATESPVVPDLTVPGGNQPATRYQLELLRREVADLREQVTALTSPSSPERR